MCSACGWPDVPGSHPRKHWLGRYHAPAVNSTTRFRRYLRAIIYVLAAVGLLVIAVGVFHGGRKREKERTPESPGLEEVPAAPRPVDAEWVKKAEQLTRERDEARAEVERLRDAHPPPAADEQRLHAAQDEVRTLRKQLEQAHRDATALREQVEALRRPVPQPPQPEEPASLSLVDFQVTERNEIWWKLSYQFSVTNRRNHEWNGVVRVQFLNVGGFVVEDHPERVKVPAGQMHNVRGFALVKADVAPTVVRAEVK